MVTHLLISANSGMNNLWYLKGALAQNQYIEHDIRQDLEEAGVPSCFLDSKRPDYENDPTQRGINSFANFKNACAQLRKVQAVWDLFDAKRYAIILKRVKLSRKDEAEATWRFGYDTEYPGRGIDYWRWVTSHGLNTDWTEPRPNKTKAKQEQEAAREVDTNPLASKTRKWKLRVLFRAAVSARFDTFQPLLVKSTSNHT